jgi:type IV pilus assembly protein PilW
MMQIQTRQHRQQGFSLVEMMVAMLVSLILLAGVSQIYLSSRQSYRMQESLSRVQENGRFALEFLSRDIRMSDFWGCANLDQVTNNLNPAGGTGYIDYDQGGLSASDNTGMNGTDVIILRGAYSTNMNVLPNGMAGYGPLQSSDITIGNNNNLNQCDIVIIADCAKADIFQINNANPGGTGQLVHNTGTTCSPSNYNTVSCTGGNAHCLSKIYAGDASIYRMQQVVYSLGAGAQGEPALFRQQNGNAALELVDGIADFQLRYGEDIDGDLTADYYVPASQVVDLGRVVSVRVWVLARSYEDNLAPTPQTYNWETGPVTAADNRLYQVFTSTIAMRNRIK